ncbi:hypothetical protein F4827_004106 [Paraburkholderia bannensis]|uniref:Uncharacterized protein n=1 Tax=Paraburkholderia bannensis TaxID=765414 RepID=A0A7W9WUD0_9BURK|nr:hypothetical protein [Paraburkholderia bannensis]MBB3259232.1 hypothetical protein [Paraburkholderia sp. WP4_3_2]MBB6104247.1 hypothetical protein [Paraburkholderia bannensis]
MLSPLLVKFATVRFGFPSLLSFLFGILIVLPTSISAGARERSACEVWRSDGRTYRLTIDEIALANLP